MASSASTVVGNKRIYRFHRTKDIPAAFWLDKSVFWDQPPYVIKDDEEVEEEWQDVKAIYQELRKRMKRHLVTFSYAIFVADGDRPSLGDRKAGVSIEPPSYESIFNEDGQEWREI